MSITTIGLIADTHVPDRRRDLHPAVLPTFERAKVSMILHAGDISVPRVLAQLGKVAPVLAARGNRDWFGFKDLPVKRVVEVGELRIGLAHGHVSWWVYVKEKLAYLTSGRPQSFDYFMQRAVVEMPNVDAIIFGHNHEPMISQVDGKLVVNPGSACCQVLPGKAPSVGLLHIDGRDLRAEIVFLE